MNEILIMITKDLLNKNRVLTMSNNRKCNYLSVDVCCTSGKEKDYAQVIGINTQGRTKDILVLKEIKFNKMDDLVNEIYWTCREFNIDVVLADKQGFGIGFIDAFKCNIDPNNVQIREVDSLKIDIHKAFINLKKDLENGHIRFLQTPEMAINTYKKSFLGFTNIMNFHKETNKLFNEIENIELVVNANNNTMTYKMKDNTIGKSRFSCLLLYYVYPEIAIINENEVEEDYKNKYYILKRMSQYEIIHGVFYKYMFKAVENNNIKISYYCENKAKYEQFKDMVQEKDFKNIFNKYIKLVSISRDYFKITFHNGSCIEFLIGNYSARGNRFHFAIVDTNINLDIFYNVIRYKGILFDMAKKEGLLKDDYNIEYVEM